MSENNAVMVTQSQEQSVTETGLSDRLPPEIREILATREEVRGTEFGLQSVQAWSSPRMTEALRDEIAASIPILEKRLEGAHPQLIEKWLDSLGLLISSGAGMNEARLKIKAYCGLLKVPGSLLTKQSLERAGRQFKFFPAYAELVDFFDKEARELENMLYRAKSLAKWKKPEKTVQTEKPDWLIARQKQIEENSKHWPDAMAKSERAPLKPIFVRNPETESFIDQAMRDR